MATTYRFPADEESSRLRFTLDWMREGPDWRIVSGPEITDSRVKAPVLELRCDCECYQRVD